MPRKHAFASQRAELELEGIRVFLSEVGSSLSKTPVALCLPPLYDRGSRIGICRPPHHRIKFRGASLRGTNARRDNCGLLESYKMASRQPFKTTFEADEVIRPIHTGTSVAIDNGARILATVLGEHAILTDPSNGKHLAKIEGVSKYYGCVQRRY